MEPFTFIASQGAWLHVRLATAGLAGEGRLEFFRDAVGREIVSVTAGE